MTARAALRPPARAAFDRLAADYDTLTGGEIFQLLRARTHDVFARCFNAGSRVLEIGCGTGSDTQFLAARGVRVVACDASEEMVGRTLRRLSREGLDRQATALPCGVEDLESYLGALSLDGTFDGIISNFGVLNCVEHLAPLTALVRRHLVPGGHVLLNLMTRVCALEAAYFTATRRPHLARRRYGTGAVNVCVAGIDVPTYYHRVKDVSDALAHDVAPVAIYGIGIAIPPPYLELRWQTLPRAVRTAVIAVDRWLTPWPPFNRFGDHVLLHFVKNAAHD